MSDVKRTDTHAKHTMTSGTHAMTRREPPAMPGPQPMTPHKFGRP